MVTQEEFAAADAFFHDSEDPYGKRITQELVPRLRAFLALHTHRPVVVVTSGGTTVPLEKRCVRFIDNFSAGNRGALSTEQFLEAGYAVIHLHRDSAVEPFTQGLPSNSLLGLLRAAFEPVDSTQQHQHQQQELDGDHRSVPEGGVGCEASSGRGQGSGGRVVVREEVQPQIAACLHQAQRAQSQRTLLMVQFQNLFEYLQSLKCIAVNLCHLGPQALFYLAAAVSDFYIPWSELAEHKIQSSTGPLQLALHKVPKMLGMLTSIWVPDSMVVSFKLETDPGMLVRKAAAALRAYRVHIVVANLLHTRKDQVLLVTQSKGLSPTARAISDSKPDLEPGHADGESSGQVQRSSVDFTTQVWKQQELEEQSAALKQEGCCQSEVWVDAEEINRAKYEPYIERQLVSQVVGKHKLFIAQHQH